MPTPTIPAGNLYMNATTYTGTGASNAITNGASGAAFQPDFVWVKSRSTASGHVLTDVVRGVGKSLASQNADGQVTDAQQLVSFNSNGFTMGTAGDVNFSGRTYVGWQWKAGSTAVTNNVGSISSQVSANTTAGFSIVTWVGNGVTSATVGHGLGAVPALIMCKEYSVSGDYWHVKHQSTPSNTNLYLNVTLANTSAASVGDGVLGDLSSSTTFGFATAGSPGNVVAVNESGVSNVAYCWTPIAGYSAFSSYTGNGSTDGPFVYTGFRPRFVMIKCSTTGGTSYNWALVDSTRSYANVANHTLAANSADASSAYGTGVDVFGPDNKIDLLSNGFKLRDTGVWGNASGATYVYMAFAENPFKYANAR